MHSLPKSAVAALLLNTFIWGLSWTGTRALEGMGLHPVWATATIFSGCALLLLTLRHRELPLPDLSGCLLEAVEAFAEGTPQGDDITLVLVRRQA